MVIALVADDPKKGLLTQFCTAYCGILAKHSIIATAVTGRYIEESTGLEIEKVLPGTHGGIQQIATRVLYNEIDAVVYFRDSDYEGPAPAEEDSVLRACDTKNIPFATNIATAEILVMAISDGLLDWREYVNPISPYSKAHRGN